MGETGRAGPPLWLGVESTVWLRWVFGAVQRLPNGGERDRPLGS